MYFIACRPAKHNNDIIMKKAIAIIGSIPRDGIKPETFQMFNNAEVLLKAKGFYPMNPLSCNYMFPRLGIDRLPDNEKILELSEAQYGILLDAIFLDLRLSDVVYLLDNYAEDPIGYALLAMAHALGRTIYRSDHYFAMYDEPGKELPFTNRWTFQARRLPSKNISDDILDTKRREIDILKKTHGGLDVYRLLWPDAARVIDAGDLKKPFKRRAELVGSCFIQLNDLGSVDRYLVMDFSIVDYPGYDCFEWVRREKGLPTRYQACIWIETILKLHVSDKTSIHPVGRVQ